MQRGNVMKLHFMKYRKLSYVISAVLLVVTVLLVVWLVCWQDAGAGCPWVLHSHQGPGSPGYCCLAPCETPPHPSLPPTAGLPGEQWRRPTPLASGRCGLGTRCPSRCARLQLAPPPSPFFSPLCVQALLIREQGPFMWCWPRWAAPTHPWLGISFASGARSPSGS